MVNLSQIELYPNAVSQEQCQLLIDLIDTVKTTDNSSLKIHDRSCVKIHDRPGKQSTDLYCNFADTLSEEQHPIFKQTNNILYPVLETLCYHYKIAFPFLNKISPWKLHNWYNLQYYSEGQGYSALHSEHDSVYTCEHKKIHKIAADRMLVWMIYLNDAECGTHFPAQEITIQPQAGLGVIWPAFWTHPHQGVTPNIGDKYIATGWFSFYDPFMKVAPGHD